MALVSTFRDRVASSANTTAYSTNLLAYTPAASSLLVVFAVSALNTGPADPATVTGHGVSFAFIASILNTSWRIGVWVADAGATPDATVVTATWAASQQGCILIEYEVTGWNTAVGASAAVVQSPTNSGTGTSGSVALAAASYADNRPLSGFVIAANEAITERTNWTPHGSGGSGFNTPNTAALGQHRNDAFETTASASWTSSVVWAGIAIEVAEAGAGGGAFDPSADPVWQPHSIARVARRGGMLPSGVTHIRGPRAEAEAKALLRRRAQQYAFLKAA